jgi:hypothetical protein|tara:strand:- start:576 stop:935 length:360 start_codon:yes stop_codon:yes gene_type:complete
MNNSNISILLGQRYDDHPDQAEEPTNFQDKSFQVFQDYADWLERVDMPELAESLYLWDIKGIGHQMADSLLDTSFKSIKEIDQEYDEDDFPIGLSTAHTTKSVQLKQSQDVEFSTEGIA